MRNSAKYVAFCTYAVEVLYVSQCKLFYIVNKTDYYYSANSVDSTLKIHNTVRNVLLKSLQSQQLITFLQISRICDD